MSSSGLTPLTLIQVTPAATSAPRTTESNHTESVSGSAARRRMKVFVTKAKSIAASTRRAAQTAGGARLRDIEETGGRNGHHEIKGGPAEIESERPMGRARADLAHAHELGQSR